MLELLEFDSLHDLDRFYACEYEDYDYNEFEDDIVLPSSIC